MYKDKVEKVVKDLNGIVFDTLGEQRGDVGEVHFTYGTDGSVLWIHLNGEAIWDSEEGSAGAFQAPAFETFLRDHALAACAKLGENLLRVSDAGRGIERLNEVEASAAERAAQILEDAAAHIDPAGVYRYLTQFAAQLRSHAQTERQKPPATPADQRRAHWMEALRRAVNACSRESGSNTPDFVIAEMLASLLEAYDRATRARDSWYGLALSPKNLIQAPGAEPGE